MVEGRFRDPLVGRQILYGLAIGSFCAVLYHAVNGLPSWLPFGAASQAVGRALGVLMAFFVLRLFISRKVILIGALTLISTAFGLGGENALLETPLAFVTGLVAAYMVVQ